MASAGPYASLHSLQTDNHTSTPPLIFLQAGCPSCHPTNSVKALKANKWIALRPYYEYPLRQIIHLSPVLFLWRYEPVRRTGKSDDWLTIFFARIIRFTVQKFQLFWVIFCIIIFFIELWHILILWLAKMPNGGMPVFTLIATVVTYCTEASNQKSKYAYRKIFFYKKKHWFTLYCRLHNRLQSVDILTASRKRTFRDRLRVT